MWLSESTFSLHVDDDDDVFNGDNDDFKDYGGDGVNVRIDILCEKLVWRNGSHVFPTAASFKMIVMSSILNHKGLQHYYFQVPVILSDKF